MDINEEKFTFFVEWFDEIVQIKRRFLLSYYPSDSSVEMKDVVAKKLFLRRIKCNTVKLSDFFIGNMVTILSRQLCITDFGDNKTAEKFSRDVESTVIIVNDSGFRYLGKIISVIEKNNLALNKGKMLDKDRSGFNSSSFCERLEGRFLVLEVRGENAINILRKILNPEAPLERPLNADLGDLCQHCIGPLDESSAKQEVKIFFPVSKEVHCNTARFVNSVLCIIKPHAVSEKKVGLIIQAILDAGFQISALEVLTFSLTNASEFLEVYKGVVPEYKDMVAQLTSGHCIALEITADARKNIVMDFRTFVGPSDPEIAKSLRPGTLRALYGHDKVQNAVHCTDLPEDALLELDYVFRILPS